MFARHCLPALFLALSACSKESLLDPKMAVSDAPPEAPKASATAPAEAAVPPGAVARPYVDQILREGPSWMLSQVDVEEVVTAGKFVGWRVRALPSEWATGELRAGDVVTKVNGLGLEKPDDFWAAWATLGVASELKVDYLRGAEARVLTVPIVGKPDPAASGKVATDQAPTERPARDRRFDTVTIQGDAGSSQTPVDWTVRN